MYNIHMSEPEPEEMAAPVFYSEGVIQAMAAVDKIDASYKNKYETHHVPLLFLKVTRSVV